MITFNSPFRRLPIITTSTLALFLLLQTPAFVSDALAEASLAIAPTRVVFEGRTRTASVNLINNGSTGATFRISFERKRMTEEGDIKNIKTPEAGELFADQMLRYSPRQITLAPGQAQVVRLMLRKPPNLEAGEYRSHLLFREVPTDSSTSITKHTGSNGKLNIQIIPVVGLSIPVIVRHGKTEASITLTNLSLQRQKGAPGSAMLTMVANRSGNQSVYGDFTVYLDPGAGKEKLVVSKSNGLAIYTPNKSRKLDFRIQAPSGVSLDKGKLEVVYRTPPDQGDKVLATALFSLN